MKSAFVACTILIALARPAAAQEAPGYEIAAAYSRVQQYGYDGMFNGFLVGVGRAAGPRFVVLAEASGTDLPDSTTYAFLGGARFMDRHGKVSLFAQGLAGVTRQIIVCCYRPATGFTVQPGGGIDVHVSSRTSIRGHVDYRFIFANFDERGYTRGIRLSLGVAFGFGAR